MSDEFSIVINLAEIIKKQEGVQSQSIDQSEAIVEQSEAIVEQSEAVVKQREAVVEKSQEDIEKVVACQIKSISNNPSPSSQLRVDSSKATTRTSNFVKRQMEPHIYSPNKK
ncbi:hypothetical protein L6452_15527 [Arctium lappa]|uniref:Uncharacterized protein n=1 Tax=Arctium lappa TaxID=4217 RepID=A0ACB9CNX9_ARCLA|nr:hypothetical protein L6452_15527 [Arctium lappa]